MPKRTSHSDRDGTVYAGPGYRLHMRTPDALPPQSERSFQQQMYDAARLLGWKAYHTHDARHSAAGFPDLILTRRPRVLAAELKRDGERPTPAQLAWLEELAASGVETFVWTPADWDAAMEILKR